MTQDLKELLELAAKACGYHGLWQLDGEFYAAKTGAEGWAKNEFKPGVVYEKWRPDIDDGDGARMEAECAISPYFHVDAVTSTTSGQVTFEDFINITELLAEHNGDRQAARRLASLRVAAEVGRRMK